MSDPAFLSWLGYFLPPAVGAVIGYVTNAVAIKMLFRPLSEKKIGGFRIPFTPGVIPRQRYQLAESIGKMVSDRLLTPEAIHSHLGSSDFQKKLKKSITEMTGSLYSMPVKNLVNRMEEGYKSDFREIVDLLLRNISSSPVFKNILRKIIEGFVHNLLNKRIDELIENKRGEPAEKILDILFGVKTEEWLRRKGTAFIREKMRDNTPLSDFIPDAFFSSLLNSFDAVLPFLAEALLKWLRSEPVREVLETRGQLLLRDILDKLNIVQRFLVSMAQYDRTLKENMPGIVKDALSHTEKALHSGEFIISIKKGMKNVLRRYSETGLADFSGDQKLKPDEFLENFLSGIFDFMNSRDIRNKLHDSAGRFYRENRKKEAGDFLEEIFLVPRSELCDRMVDKIDSLVFRGGGSLLGGYSFQFILDFIKSQEAGAAEVLGLNAAFKKQFDKFLLDLIIKALDAHLPQAVAEMRVKDLVVGKINALDIRQVEELLLMVIARHLKWINIFGALLGGLIGMSQVLLNIFL